MGSNFNFVFIRGKKTIRGLSNVDVDASQFNNSQMCRGRRMPNNGMLDKYKNVLVIKQKLISR